VILLFQFCIFSSKFFNYSPLQAYLFILFIEYFSQFIDFLLISCLLYEFFKHLLHILISQSIIPIIITIILILLLLLSFVLFEFLIMIIIPCMAITHGGLYISMSCKFLSCCYITCLDDIRNILMTEVVIGDFLVNSYLLSISLKRLI